MKVAYIMIPIWLFCLATAKLVQLEIAPYQVDCLGSIPTKCLQVRENFNAEFVNFKGQIQWFTLQEGIRSFIVADKTLFSNPAPGYSNVNYVMKRSIISYADDAESHPSDPNISSWGRVHYEPLDTATNLDETSSKLLMQPTDELVGNWFLVAVNNNDLSKPPLVSFTNDSINYVYCNTKGLNYQRSGNSMTITNDYSTMMLCTWLIPSEEIVDKAFLDCARLLFKDYDMTCFNANEKTVLRLQR